MLELIAILAAIALFDSLSMVPIAVLPLATALGGGRPLLTALAFIAGIFVAYLSFGILLVGGMDMAFDYFGDYLSRLWNEPNALELTVQIAIGALLVISAGYLFRLRPKAVDTDAEPPPALRPGAMFTLGVTLIVVGIPGAVPYLAAAERIVSAEPNWVASAGYLTIYNFFFVAPFLALVVIFFALPTQSGKICSGIARFAAAYLPKIAAALFFIVGLVMVADGIGWFVGYPILPTN